MNQMASPMVSHGQYNVLESAALIWFVSPATCSGAAPPWGREQRPGDGAGAASTPRCAGSAVYCSSGIDMANGHQTWWFSEPM